MTIGSVIIKALLAFMVVVNIYAWASVIKMLIEIHQGKRMYWKKLKSPEREEAGR